jgi:hypothetical protein
MVMGYVLFEMTTCNVVVDVEPVGWSPVQPIYPTTNSSTANDVGVFSLSAIESIRSTYTSNNRFGMYADISGGFE